MKKSAKIMAVALAVLATVPVNAAFTYDKDTQILTDGVWTFEGIGLAKDGVSMTVKGSSAIKKPDVPSKLDFSDVKDSSGKALKVVTLGGFQGLNVSEVIAPDCTAFSGQNCFFTCKDLKRVVLAEDFGNLGGARAFSGCTSLEEFSPRILQVNGVTGSAFASCSKLPGSFVLPKCTSVGKHAFSDCALLESVSAPLVDEILEGAFSGCESMSVFCFEAKAEAIEKEAFAEIAPGALLYMHAEPPETIGSIFVGNLKAPFTKVVLKDNYDAWLDKIAETHYVVRKEEFNNRDMAFDGKTWNWAFVAGKMGGDTEMCSVAADKTVSVKAKGVLAFVLEKSGDKQAANLSSFWVLKAPKSGFAIKVR